MNNLVISGPAEDFLIRPGQNGESASVCKTIDTNALTGKMRNVLIPRSRPRFDDLSVGQDDRLKEEEEEG